MSLQACTMTLGGNAKSFFAHLIEDPTHHIIMSRPLGATNCSCQTIQGTKLFIHYIEGSTAQLVKHKALNLVDVDSSPMMGVTSYDVIFIEVYIKSRLNIILLSRPLGATHHCSNLHDYTYKVPAHYCIMTRPLGATLVEVFMSIRQLQVPGCCKHDNPALGGYIIWSIQFLLSDWDEQHGFLLKWQYLY